MDGRACKRQLAREGEISERMIHHLRMPPIRIRVLSRQLSRYVALQNRNHVKFQSPASTGADQTNVTDRISDITPLRMGINGRTSVDHDQICAVRRPIAPSRRFQSFVGCECDGSFSQRDTILTERPFRASPLRPTWNARTQPYLTTSSSDLARGAIHHGGWFHGLTRGSNRLEFKKGNFGASPTMNRLGIDITDRSVYVKQMKRKRRRTRCEDGKCSRISCRSNRGIRLICGKWKPCFSGERNFLVKGKFHVK